jgi:hypothetical protein
LGYAPDSLLYPYGNVNNYLYPNYLEKKSGGAAYEKKLILQYYTENLRDKTTRGQIPQGLELYSTSFGTQYGVFIGGRVLCLPSDLAGKHGYIRFPPSPASLFRRLAFPPQICYLIFYIFYNKEGSVYAQD